MNVYEAIYVGDKFKTAFVEAENFKKGLAAAELLGGEVKGLRHVLTLNEVKSEDYPF